MDDTPLTVSARQTIDEVGRSTAPGSVTLGQKQRLLAQLHPLEPVSGLPVELVTGPDSPPHSSNSDGDGIVTFRRGEDFPDYKAGVFAVRYSPSVHTVHQMRNSEVKTLELPRTDKEEVRLEVYLDWDGRFLLQTYR